MLGGKGEGCGGRAEKPGWVSCNPNQEGPHLEGRTQVPQKFKSHVIYSYVCCISNVVGGGARVTVQDDQRAAWGTWFSPPTKCILGTELSRLGSTGLFLLSQLVDPSWVDPIFNVLKIA